MLSVIIPNVNDVRIRRAVASVRAQTNCDYELLIVDGGSSDRDLLAYYQTCGAQVLIEPDEGTFDALNKGIARCHGDVVYLMGADDQLSDPAVFSTVMAELSRDTSLDGVCIGCEFVNAGGRVVRRWYPRNVSAANIKRGLLPPHFSLFLRRDLYAVVGEFKYREYGRVACDTAWLLDLAIRKSDVRIKVLPRHHLRMEYGGASTGSWSAVWRQFVAVHRHARRNARHLKLWYAYSPIRTASKLSQFRPFM